MKLYIPGMKVRAHVQNHRIQQGIQSGQLSEGELETLKDGRGDIKEAIQFAKADNGWIGLGERREIHKMFNEQSQFIFDLKHNDDIADPGMDALA